MSGLEILLAIELAYLAYTIIMDLWLNIFCQLEDNGFSKPDLKQNIMWWWEKILSNTKVRIKGIFSQSCISEWTCENLIAADFVKDFIIKINASGSISNGFKGFCIINLILPIYLFTVKINK